MKKYLFFASFIPLQAFCEEPTSSKIDVFEVFQGSPIIYTVLGILSICSLMIWLYSIVTLKLSQIMPNEFLKHVRGQLAEKRFDAALAYCEQSEHLGASIIASGIQARSHGPQVMMETMHAEGKRCGVSLWQRISLLNDIAAIAPMLGLLGTVVGMFYAFYDVNRTLDTLSSIFDGLGIAIGTTVAGLIVAILAMIFYTTLKFRVIRLLNIVENEAVSLSNMIIKE